MKRLLFVVLCLIITVSLAACAPKDINDFNASIVKETLTDDAIIVNVVIEEEITSDEALRFIGNEVAVEIYMKHQSTIGLTPMTMTIYLFSITDDTNTTNASYGYMIFEINETSSTPGLNQGTYHQ